MPESSQTPTTILGMRDRHGIFIEYIAFYILRNHQNISEQALPSPSRFRVLSILLPYKASTQNRAEQSESQECPFHDRANVLIPTSPDI